MLQFPRGSEWRRWDLHVHTPGTLKNDRYVGDTLEEKWDNFYNSIDEYIGDGKDPIKNIVAIGITDYLSIDNYNRIVNEKRLNAQIKLVLPNVELRMIPLAKESPINIHCIFNPSIVDQLESRFFGKLNIKYGNSAYSATHSELVRLGKTVSSDKEIKDEEALRLGAEQFVVDITSLTKVFEEDTELRENTIIVVSNSTSDGASGIKAHSDFFSKEGIPQTEATRREVYHLADLVFSGNKRDREYFLGCSTDKPEDVVSKCGSLKGCIHGSDAHTNSKLFRPDEKRYCWIKADPTFNGLKQVIYEPDTRIRIGETITDDKPGYQVIDSVRIGDEKVQDDAILFNDKLTCIIGGKSTGKSLLLHNLAMAIDSDQVNKKCKTAALKTDGRQLKDVVVKWKDGVDSSDEKSLGRKIVYIPQTYLNRLSDETEEVTEIDEIIKDVVLVSDDARKAYDRMQIALSSQKTTVERLIYEAIREHETIEEKKKESADIGSKVGIERELKRLNALKDRLTKESAITENEIEGYNAAIARKKSIEDLTEKLLEDKTFLEEQETVIAKIPINHQFEKEMSSLFDEVVDEVVAVADIKWNEGRSVLTGEINQRIHSLSVEKKSLDKTIEKLAPKIEENESIKAITVAILAEKEKLNKVNSYEHQISGLNQELGCLLRKLAGEFVRYYGVRKEYQDTINDDLSIEKDGLEFFVETPFRKDAFVEYVSNITDIRTLNANKNLVNLETLDQEWISEANIVNLIEAYLSGKLKLLKRKTPENALRELLSDWYNTTYRVKMGNDAIDEMSPGKKALALLKLLINLAESKCPILIDQPEDDLDNRSVFEELIPFIKTKKFQRQIIIVTHNANVVLGGDAEEVIVANQDGKNTPNLCCRFEYRSGGIEEDRRIDDKSVLNSQGIQQHICDVLEGGEKAFDLRKHKYQI